MKRIVLFLLVVTRLICSMEAPRVKQQSYAKLSHEQLQERQRLTDELINILDNLKRKGDQIPGEEINKIKRFIAQGADVNGFLRNTPAIFSAVMTLNAEIIRLFLTHGADINTRDPINGSNALHLYLSSLWTIDPTTLPIVEILIESGIDLNARTATRQTALMLAAEKARPSVVRLLIKGASPAAQQKFEHPLGQAHKVRGTYMNLLPEDVIRVTAQYAANKADPNLKDNSGKTALNYAIEGLETIVANPDRYHRAEGRTKEYEEIIDILDPITKK